ncbi:hypothetical protein BCR33DRAFT_720550 [Rhizoclosmatium globosum]|uniref:Uncharacterized protein n=1 Tax=Rhizoclosmatium globosum TaxID=329046 RepID=A0A1Y2BW70_9FUNG|nr:hypothetical protein BCR33DRAFT_720550 [Rhizoclosmatium globosum]|eukprot:ORY38907.1 hypothetical protein BCR33DRAFT_720550 [Rhizoclosmatium globosum]
MPHYQQYTTDGAEVIDNSWKNEEDNNTVAAELVKFESLNAAKKFATDKGWHIGSSVYNKKKGDAKILITGASKRDKYSSLVSITLEVKGSLHWKGRILRDKEIVGIFWVRTAFCVHSHVAALRNGLLAKLKIDAIVLRGMDDLFEMFGRNREQSRRCPCPETDFYNESHLKKCQEIRNNSRLLRCNCEKLDTITHFMVDIEDSITGCNLYKSLFWLVIENMEFLVLTREKVKFCKFQDYCNFYFTSNNECHELSDEVLDEAVPKLGKVVLSKNSDTFKLKANADHLLPDEFSDDSDIEVGSEDKHHEENANSEADTTHITYGVSTEDENQYAERISSDSDSEANDVHMDISGEVLKREESSGSPFKGSTMAFDGRGHSGEEMKSIGNNSTRENFGTSYVMSNPPLIKAEVEDQSSIEGNGLNNQLTGSIAFEEAQSNFWKSQIATLVTLPKDNDVVTDLSRKITSKSIILTDESTGLECINDVTGDNVLVRSAVEKDFVHYTIEGKNQVEMSWERTENGTVVDELFMFESFPEAKKFSERNGWEFWHHIYSRRTPPLMTGGSNSQSSLLFIRLRRRNGSMYQTAQLLRDRDDVDKFWIRIMSRPGPQVVIAQNFVSDKLNIKAKIFPGKDTLFEAFGGTQGHLCVCGRTDFLNSEHHLKCDTLSSSPNGNGARTIDEIKLLRCKCQKLVTMEELTSHVECDVYKSLFWLVIEQNEFLVLSESKVLLSTFEDHCTVYATRDCQVHKLVKGSPVSYEPVPKMARIVLKHNWTVLRNFEKTQI